MECELEKIKSFCPVVQSIVSLTSLLNTLIFFVVLFYDFIIKYTDIFCRKKYFSTKKVLAYIRY